MKIKIQTQIFLLILLSLGGTSASAHHSFSAEFDANKTIELEGIVTKVEWTNPHVWIYINVKDEESNTTVNWGLELGPPHLLQRRGWRRNSLQIGTLIQTNGFLARNGSDRVNARDITLSATGGAPGVVLDAGSSQLEEER